jgi:tetratricopeptide (TPR) repeat protein
MIGLAHASGGLDYDEAMKFWFQLAVVYTCSLSAWAQPVAAKASAVPQKSALDAPLFYQLLLGELNVRQGSPGSGFSMLLDAARKTRDPALYQRAVDVALQSRSGDAALQAVQAWKKDIPEAMEANRYLLQILLALNRVPEAGEALATSIKALPASEKNAAIASAPRVFARVQDKKLAADTVQKALQEALQERTTSASAWTTIGRMRREAGQLAQAVEATRQGFKADPSAQGPLILALSLAGAAASEVMPLLEQAMQGEVQPELRLGYARAFINQSQNQAALRELARLNTEHADFADGWLVHGLMLQDMGKFPEASTLLQRYVSLVESAKTTEAASGLSEALMALAQMAQRQGQLAQARQWLDKVPANADPIKLASRQADLLAQQGRLEEARKVLADIPANSPEQTVRKTLVQSQWLREYKQADAAYTLVKKVLSEQADNTDLMSELALVSEKLKRFEEMESLLRELIRRKPEDPHAFNALGYSLADRNLRLKEARQLIEQALKLAPNDAYIQDSLGWVAFRQGQFQEAVQILRTAYRTKPDAEIAAHLGEVLWVMGQTQEAGAIWREGLMLKVDNDTLVETLQRFNFKP